MENDFTAEERAFLSAYYQDRDRRRVKGFSLTKPEIVAIMRAGKAQPADDREAVASAAHAHAERATLKIEDQELTRLLDLAHPAPAKDEIATQTVAAPETQEVPDVER